MSVHVVKIPEKLAEELDRVAGRRRRSAYVIEVLWNDVRRRRQRQALRLSAGAWKDHPELAQGGAAYVEQIRSEPDERFESALARRTL